MANATSQLTLSKALEIAKQNQNDDINPAVTKFLGQSIDSIWQRVQAQPSTYMFTKEEFSVFSYYRGVFRDNEIAQQAVRRFWEHRGLLQPADTKGAAVISPRMTAEIALGHEELHRMRKTVSRKLAVACQRCREARIRCDAKKPACTACNGAGTSAECTYIRQRKNERFAGRNFNADESEEFHGIIPRSIFSKKSKVTADRKKEIEGLKEFSKNLKYRMPKESPTESTQTISSWGSPIKRQDERTSQTWQVDQGHPKSAETLHVHLTQFRMQVEIGEEYNLVNSIKLYVEYVTGETWDWWPLGPTFRQLLEDEIRIRWHCVSGHAHWIVLSKTGLLSSPEAFRRKAATQCAPSKEKKPDSPSENSSITSKSRSSGSESSVGRSSPATSESGSSDQPDDKVGSDKEINPPGTSIAVNIVPPSNLTGFVLFGVHGSKRLQGATLRLAQIDVAVYKDDDSFFDEMIVQYRKLRGFLRWIFSIWVFHTCEFILFHKANPNEIMPGPEEIPSVKDRDYVYNTSRNPPILSTVFNANFYGCKQACIKSHLDFLCLFHQCKGRIHCGKFRVLERLPKRQRKWDIDRDEEKEEAWGLNAVFAVSFYKVTLYHMLILAGPIVSWGLWLKKWPADWQNASVPFFAVVVLLSLFWLPFAQNASPADRKRSSTVKLD